MRYLGTSCPNAKVVLTVVTVLLVAAAAAATHPGTWTAREDLTEDRWFAATAEVNGIIYTIGGYLNNQPSDTVFVFDPAGDHWTEKTPMPTPRGLAATAVVNGKIYVIGGALDGGPTATAVVEVYDPATDSWESRTDMPTVLWGSAAAAVDGKIYVIGGGTGDSLGEYSVYSTVYVNDPAVDSWDTATDMPTARAFLGTSVVDGLIYAAGGLTELESIFSDKLEIYDPAADTWTTGADMPTARDGLATVVVDGELYAFGGFDSGRVIPEVEVYTPGADSWEQSTLMPNPRWGLGAAVIDDTIYLIGGGLTNYLEASNYVDTYDPNLYTSWTEVAAHLPGAFGSQWRTDIWAANMEDESANVEIILHSFPPVIYHSLSDTIEATQQKAFTDVVGTMGFEGKAMLSVRSDQPLHSAGRLYSQDDDGTFGQFCQFRTMDDGFAKNAVVYLTGLRQEEGLFRTNLVFANSGIREATLMVQLFSDTGDDVNTFFVLELQPGKMEQRVEVFANEGGQPNVGWGYAKIKVLEGAGVRISASVIDSMTNDATTIVAER